MQPEWYYSADVDNEYYIVFADAHNSSSKRRFRASDGHFIDEAKGGHGISLAEAFRVDISSARRLGALRGRPNLQDAVNKGRLPSDVLGELQRLKRSIVG